MKNPGLHPLSGRLFPFHPLLERPSTIHLVLSGLTWHQNKIKSVFYAFSSLNDAIVSIRVQAIKSLITELAQLRFLSQFENSDDGKVLSFLQKLTRTFQCVIAKLDSFKLIFLRSHPVSLSDGVIGIFQTSRTLSEKFVLIFAHWAVYLLVEE